MLYHEKLEEDKIIEFQVGDLLTRFGMSKPDKHGTRRERGRDAGIIMSICPYTISARYDYKEDPKEKERKRVQIYWVGPLKMFAKHYSETKLTRLIREGIINYHSVKDEKKFISGEEII
jgi:hypothetical protein